MANFDPVSIVLFIITILIVILIIYVATRLVTKEEIVSSTYLARLFITALAIVVLVPLLSSFLSNPMGMGSSGAFLAIIISFLILVIIMRYVIVSEVSLGNEWIEALGIALLCLIFIYIFNAFLVYIGQEPLFSVF